MHILERGKRCRFTMTKNDACLLAHCHSCPRVPMFYSNHPFRANQQYSSFAPLMIKRLLYSIFGNTKAAVLDFKACSVHPPNILWRYSTTFVNSGYLSKEEAIRSCLPSLTYPILANEFPSFFLFFSDFKTQLTLGLTNSNIVIHYVTGGLIIASITECTACCWE